MNLYICLLLIHSCYASFSLIPIIQLFLNKHNIQKSWRMQPMYTRLISLHNHTVANLSIGNYGLRPEPLQPKRIIVEHTFTRLSYEQGVRQIHSIEQLESFYFLNKLNCFHILNTSVPRSINSLKVIHAKCSILGYNNTFYITMYTKDRDISNIQVRTEIYSKPIFSVHLHVTPTKDNIGHHLQILLSFQSNSFHFVKNIQFIIKTMCILEDKVCWSYDFKKNSNSENLFLYRRMVLFPFVKSISK